MNERAQVRSLAVAGRIRTGNRTVLAALTLTSIRPNPRQPRRHFDPNALAELAASIKARGLLQPLVVTPDGDGYMLMAGERRWRAAQLAGLDSVPALIRSDDPLEVAMIENLQRADLTPIEEAEGLGHLIDRFGYTHEQLAEMVGKSRPYVSNTLVLCRLPEEIKAWCHAEPAVSREILIQLARAESPERQAMLWRMVRLRKLSVQKFRAEAAGSSVAGSTLRDLARLARRLGRTVRTLDIPSLPCEERQHLERLLRRIRSRVERALEAFDGDC
ncbi:MAG: ParB/RepB/Spo0J family partition protein [Deltaproteobacteria bacterium]|nr:ParB/RepB/Spo0J family partition protein [Deltaproteobacteria bacterium]